MLRLFTSVLLIVALLRFNANGAEPMSDAVQSAAVNSTPPPDLDELLDKFITSEKGVNRQHYRRSYPY